MTIVAATSLFANSMAAFALLGPWVTLCLAYTLSLVALLVLVPIVEKQSVPLGSDPKKVDSSGGDNEEAQKDEVDDDERDITVKAHKHWTKGSLSGVTPGFKLDLEELLVETPKIQGRPSTRRRG
jgi:hypothetical protein